jgi:prevent-host-death family protein
MNTQVSIGQVKRDISQLVNRVSFAGERIILTSRGKPKAALINIEDYERLLKSENRAADIQKWLADTRALSSQIEKRKGQVDVDAIMAADRDDLEQRQCGDQSHPAQPSPGSLPGAGEHFRRNPTCCPGALGARNHLCYCKNGSFCTNYRSRRASGLRTSCHAGCAIVYPQPGTKPVGF